MDLKNTTYKYKVDKSMFYQFKKDNGYTEVLEITKTKAGYSYNFKGENMFISMDGIKTIDLLMKGLNNRILARQK